MLVKIKNIVYVVFVSFHSHTGKVSFCANKRGAGYSVVYEITLIVLFFYENKFLCFLFSFWRGQGRSKNFHSEYNIYYCT